MNRHANLLVGEEYKKSTMAKKKKTNNGPALSDERLIKERMRRLEIGRCFVSEHLEDGGYGLVIVSRNHTGGRISFCAYMIDTLCLGLKDATWTVRGTEEDLDFYSTKLGDVAMRECDYNEAHNWVYGAIAWAEDAGIEPPKCWRLAQYFLEEDTDEVPLMELPFGQDGKHFLLAKDQTELNRYLPLLMENLGDNFDYVVEDGDEDYYDDEDEDYIPPIFQTMKEMDEREQEYTYQHPQFPETLHLHHPDIMDTLGDTNHPFITAAAATRLLTLPHEELREDLEQAIRFALGKTYTEEYCEEVAVPIENAIMLLGEVGNSESSLDTVLEAMRLPEDKYYTAISDYNEDTLDITLYKLGNQRLDTLHSFMREAGLYNYTKTSISTAVSEIVYQTPERRAEVIVWYRNLLRETIADGPETILTGLATMGFIISDLIDIHATDLLPEIQQLFELNLVDYSVCGRWEVVKRSMMMGDSRRRKANLDLSHRLKELAKELQQ